MMEKKKDGTVSFAARRHYYRLREKLTLRLRRAGALAFCLRYSA